MPRDLSYGHGYIDSQKSQITNHAPQRESYAPYSSNPPLKIRFVTFARPCQIFGKRISEWILFQTTFLCSIIPIGATGSRGFMIYL